MKQYFQIDTLKYCVLWGFPWHRSIHALEVLEHLFSVMFLVLLTEMCFK